MRAVGESRDDGDGDKNHVRINEIMAQERGRGRDVTNMIRFFVEIERAGKMRTWDLRMDFKLK